jgi:putative phosphonate metabolism protein
MDERVAVYVMPTGLLGEFGAAWLGWDALSGELRPHPQLSGLDVAALTETPRRYGFHGTIKPPFRLRPGCTRAALGGQLAALCNQMRPVTLPRLRLARMGQFLALVPERPSPDAVALAAKVVRDLDPFRAAMSDSDLARRRGRGLSPAHERNLLQWGYPHVMDQFRFHITLTGRLDRDTLDAAERSLAPRVADVLPDPFRIDKLTLVREDTQGFFHAIDRYPMGLSAE